MIKLYYNEHIWFSSILFPFYFKNLPEHHLDKEILRIYD